jgi:hypothetical protein
MNKAEQIKVGFAVLKGQHLAIGVRFIAFTRKGSKLQLVKFIKVFIEPDWGLSERTGYVVKGELEIQLANRTERFEAGGGIFIQAGEAATRQVQVPAEPATLILVEEA